MRAEEVWDSLLTLVMPEVDEREGAQTADGLYGSYDEFKDKTPEQILGMGSARRSRARSSARSSRPSSRT